MGCRPGYDPLSAGGRQAHTSEQRGVRHRGADGAPRRGSTQKARHSAAERTLATTSHPPGGPEYRGWAAEMPEDAVDQGCLLGQRDEAQTPHRGQTSTSTPNVRRISSAQHWPRVAPHPTCQPRPSARQGPRPRGSRHSLPTARAAQSQTATPRRGARSQRPAYDCGFQPDRIAHRLRPPLKPEVRRRGIKGERQKV